MVFVDFSNAFLRTQLATGSYHAIHEAEMRRVIACLPVWIEEADAAAAAEGDVKPLAVVLDIDEVLLANIHENSWGDFHAADHYAHPVLRSWPRNDLVYGPALPGAAQLLDALISHGVKIVLNTGRRESLRAETLANLHFVGLHQASIASLYMAPEACANIQQHKEEVRRALGAECRIIANVGDQVSDLGAHGTHQVLIWNPFYWTA